MKHENVTLLCKEGLHLRVASQVAKIAQKAGGTVKIRSKKERSSANACSVLELLTLGATSGTSLEIVAEGPNEETVITALSEILRQEDTAL